MMIRSPVALLVLVLAACGAGCGRRPAPASPDPLPPSSQDALVVRDWGPRQVRAGQQEHRLDGGLGLYVVFDGRVVGSGAQVWLDGRQLPGAAAGNDTVTAFLPDAELATPGSRQVLVVLPSGREVRVGSLRVDPPPARAGTGARRLD